MSFFDGTMPLKVTKPIRLIELFAGIGAQAKALENLGADFERYRICEIEKSVVDSYNAVHGTFFMPTDITKLHAEDLGIVDTDKYDYILTYSFPCTDLSKVGKQKGMGKGSGTRSGLLWEVERLLNETAELPNFLLMENVPDILSESNRKDFFAWCAFLEELGYTNRYAVLNSKDFDVPQDRERCFMLSWLWEGMYYNFPRGKGRKRKLKDLLETEVDERYYLKEDAIKELNLSHTPKKREIIGYSGSLWTEEEKTEIADGRRFYRQAFETLRTNECEDGDTIDAFNQRVNKSGVSPTVTTRPEGFKTAILVVDGPIVYDGYNGVIRRDGTCVGTLTTNCGADLKRNGQGIIESEKRIRKLTPKECWRLMGFDDESYERAAKVTTHSQLYKQAGNSIVVDVLMAIFKELL